MSFHTHTYRLLVLVIICLILPVMSKEKARKTRPKKILNYSQYSWHHDGVTSEASSLLGTQMGVLETPGIEPLGYSLDGSTKVFRLTAQPIKQMLTDGKPTHHQLELAMKNILGVRHINNKQSIKAWGYNGSSPGPTLELTEGDHVRVIFKNELPEPTLIHWHGLEHPHSLEKSSDRKPVMPGQSHIYEFHAHNPGTYLYHSGCSIFKQNRYGLVGMIIVHPRHYEEPVDRHIALLIQDWSLSPTTTPNSVHSSNNWFTINGHAAPSIPRIVLQQHERVRFHIGSMGLDPYPLQLHGYTWTLVGTEGGLIPSSAQFPLATLVMNPSTTRVIEFDAWNPGIWPFYALTSHHCTPQDFVEHGGIFTLVEVIQDDTEAEWRHPNQR